MSNFEKSNKISETSFEMKETKPDYNPGKYQIGPAIELSQVDDYGMAPQEEEDNNA